MKLTFYKKGSIEMKFMEEKIMMMALKYYDKQDTPAEEIRADWT